MARLHDVFLSSGHAVLLNKLAVDAGYTEEYVNTLQTVARKAGAVPVVADNVGDYYFANDCLGKMDTDPETGEPQIAAALPNVAPPFPCMLIEMRKSRFLVQTASPAFASIVPAEWGVVCTSPPLTEADVAGILPRMFDPDCMGRDPKWVLLAEIIELRGDEVVYSGYSYVMLVNAAGKIVAGPILPPSVRAAIAALEAPAGEGGPDEVAGIYLARGLVMLLPCLLALTFMHCKKGVQTVDVRPPERLNRARVRRGRPPLVTYKTLVIGGITEILRREGKADREGIAKALHLCRGHFATYTPEKGFCGRSIARPITVFRAAHLRGSRKQGVVVKDYDVRPGDK